ncbi:SIR2 family protein [Rhizobium leguminosarum]|uniref:SIR2 family protein n=1 Tax=Rhizobium leguminosarum TaxID=384 RepID=UPI00197D102F|nr:SIR2 family protein [Rhizobium leguminosarum]
MVFFCGAGVSQARAGLSNFTQLARKVMNQLGPAGSSPARKLLDRAMSLDPIQGIGSYVATDRIFSLLEREFDTADIHAAVAAALKPQGAADRSAHELVLDLAGRRTGALRLITTNFDRLFEDCDPSITSIGPAHLPDPKRAELNAVIHLHGRVDPDYRGSDEEGFVLSSGDFGRAYLAEGWAARFIQSLLTRFSIVFLGYSADDPPVQYLLEALKGAPLATGKMYAFQSGDGSVATSLWENKGVHAMAFDPANGYSALWATLEAWVQRANDVDGWHDAVLAKALRGPAALQPHERGQVAHVLSSVEGVRRTIQLTDGGIPSSWLQVIDARERYRTPEMNPDSSEGALDPFDQVGLDDDTPPPPPNPHEDEFSYIARPREIPQGSWGGFDLQPMDAVLAPGRSGFYGDRAAQAGPLPTRIDQLAVWLMRVAHQPDAFAWALRQHDLHPRAKMLLASALDHDTDRFPGEIARGWRYLLRAWADRRGPADQAAHAISTEAERLGWSDDLVRRLVDTRRPRLEVEPPFRTYAGSSDEAVFTLKIEYPRPHVDVHIPNEMLKGAVSRIRESLEYAKSLEAEVRQSDWIYLPTTYEADGQPLDIHGHGMVGLVLEMQRLTARLAAGDPTAAHAEFLRWSKDDDGIFARLRIWAAGQPAITTADEAASVLLELSDKAFWGSLHQRDLLMSIRCRWNEFPQPSRLEIERKLISTRFPWENTSRAEQYSDLALVERLRWLVANGVQFVLDVDAKIAELSSRLGGKLPDIEHAVEDSQPRVFSIHSDRDPGDLEELPIKDVLSRADAVEGIDYRSHVHHDPFAGLVEQHPLKALAALYYEVRQGRIHAEGWSRFLRSEARGEDSNRMLRLICARLVALEKGDLSQILYPVSDWMKRLADRNRAELPDTFKALWAKMVTTADEFSAADSERYSERNWADDGLNKPIGKLTQILLQDPRIAGKHRRNSGLDAGWKTEMDTLLSLSGDLRRQALVFAAFHFPAFWYIDAKWAEKAIMPSMKSEGPDGDAFWDGFLWASKVPHPALLRKMVGTMIRRVSEGSRRKPITNSLADILLYSWVEWSEWKRPPFSDAQFREAIVEGGTTFGVQVLWNFGRRLERSAVSRDTTVRFFREVWPLQKSLKSQEISRALSSLLFKTGDLFPEIASLVLGRLVPCEDFDAYVLYSSEAGGIIESNPEMLLDVLQRLLPADVSRWPYHTGDVLDRLAQAPGVRTDKRLLQLRRAMGRLSLVSFVEDDPAEKMAT